MTDEERSYQLFQRAWEYKREKKYELSIKYYRESIKAYMEDPNMHNVFSSMGKVFYLMGKYKASARCYCMDHCLINLSSGGDYERFFYERLMPTDNCDTIAWHLGHSLIDGDPDLDDKHKLYAREYKKSIMGDQGPIMEFDDETERFYAHIAHNVMKDFFFDIDDANELFRFLVYAPLEKVND